MKPAYTLHHIDVQRAWMGERTVNMFCLGEGRPETL